MKQPKQKSPAKSARKVAKTELKERLLTSLKAILDQGKIKLTKDIKKKSKKLVKAIAGELVIDKPATPKATQVKKTITAPQTPKAAKPKAVAAPAKVTATSAKAIEKVPAKAASANPVSKVPVKAEPAAKEKSVAVKAKTVKK